LELASQNDPASYAGGRLATDRAIFAGQVKRYELTQRISLSSFCGLGWGFTISSFCGLGVGFTISHCKILNCGEDSKLPTVAAFREIGEKYKVQYRL